MYGNILYHHSDPVVVLQMVITLHLIHIIKIKHFALHHFRHRWLGGLPGRLDLQSDHPLVSSMDKENADHARYDDGCNDGGDHVNPFDLDTHDLEYRFVQHLSEPHKESGTDV